MDLSAEHYPILVTGARGLLGRALGPRLARSAPRPEAVRLTDLAEPACLAGRLDVTDARAVAAAVRDLRPRTVFHLAAWTDVDGAESHPAEAERANVAGSENVARAAADSGALVVHISTDFVFDGTKPGVYLEDDAPSPQSVYGRTKAESEARVRAAAPAHHLVVRTAWLYGAGGRNLPGRPAGFVQAILAAAREGRPLRVVTDQVGCPTWSEDLAVALLALVAADARGTFHACGRGESSRLEMAQAILDAAGLAAPIAPALTADLPPRPARRPARAVLATEKLERTTGFRFPPWRESLRALVRSLESNA